MRNYIVEVGFGPLLWVLCAVALVYIAPRCTAEGKKWSRLRRVSKRIAAHHQGFRFVQPSVVLGTYRLDQEPIVSNDVCPRDRDTTLGFVCAGTRWEYILASIQVFFGDEFRLAINRRSQIVEHGQIVRVPLHVGQNGAEEWDEGDLVLHRETGVGFITF